MRRSSTCSRRCWRSGSGSCSGHPIHPRRIHPLEVSWDPPHATDSSQARFADYPVCSSRNPAAKLSSSAVDVLRIASPFYTPAHHGVHPASKPARPPGVPQAVAERGRRRRCARHRHRRHRPALVFRRPPPTRPRLHPCAQAHRARASCTRASSPARACRHLCFRAGGVGAGSIGLGGRGQLRDWQISNWPDCGNAPGYAFPSIRVDRGARAPFVSVLEARLQPPYQGPFGLGSRSVPACSGSSRRGSRASSRSPRSPSAIDGSQSTSRSTRSPRSFRTTRRFRSATSPRRRARARRPRPSRRSPPLPSRPRRRWRG